RTGRTAHRGGLRHRPCSRGGRAAARTQPARRCRTRRTSRPAGWKTGHQMIRYMHMDSAEAVARIGHLREVYAAVFSLPPYNEAPEMADKFVGWNHEESGHAGLDLVAALDDDRLVGFAYGYTMTPGDWWQGTARTDAE